MPALPSSNRAELIIVVRLEAIPTADQTVLAWRKTGESLSLVGATIVPTCGCLQSQGRITSILLTWLQGLFHLRGEVERVMGKLHLTGEGRNVNPIILGVLPQSSTVQGKVFGSPEHFSLPGNVFGAVDAVSRRMEDLAREFDCLGYFDENDDGPRAA